MTIIAMFGSIDQNTNFYKESEDQNSNVYKKRTRFPIVGRIRSEFHSL